jgi:hypothetical protein
MGTLALRPLLPFRSFRAMSELLSAAGVLLVIAGQFYLLATIRSQSLVWPALITVLGLVCTLVSMIVDKGKRDSFTPKARKAN